MPARFRIDLVETQVHPKGLPPHCGPALHAAVLGRVHECSPALATALHEQAPPPKPYCLTPLTATQGAPGGWFFEVGVLDDEMVGAFADALGGLDRLRIGSSWLTATEASFVHSAYDELTEQARPVSRWQLSFRSPTTFRAGFGGVNRNWPLPAPYLIMKNLAHRWERFSNGCTLPTGLLDIAATHLALDRMDHVRTQLHLTHAPDGYTAGFVGDAEISLAEDRDVAPVFRRAFDLLIGYTAATGVGDQTTKGMGWVTTTPKGNRRRRA